MRDIENRFNTIRESEPDVQDLKAINRIKQMGDTSDGITLDEMDKLRMERDEYSGKISLRVPKSLHRELARGAKKEGISLNQFILYKLAK